MIFPHLILRLLRRHVFSAALTASGHGADVFIETPTVDLSSSYLFSPFNTDMAVNSQAIGVCMEFKSLPSGDQC